jgi:hypothetical protein
MAKSEIVARERPYSDLDFAFRANPITGELAIKRNVEAVKQSVLNILSTNLGERPFLPLFGADIRKYLFDNFNQIKATLIEEQVGNALSNYEPRVRVLNIDVDGTSRPNEIRITVEFEIRSPERDIASVNFTIERLR